MTRNAPRRRWRGAPQPADWEWVSLKMPPSLRAEYDALAMQARRSRSALMLAVLTAGIDYARGIAKMTPPVASGQPEQAA